MHVSQCLREEILPETRNDTAQDSAVDMSMSFLVGSPYIAFTMG